VNETLRRVTDEIIERSRDSRRAYLERIERAKEVGARRGRLACSNLAHSFAACNEADKSIMQGAERPNIGIVSAYNDMLSGHQPFERFPQLIKEAVREVGAVAQFAGGVPAMCDGVTQGRPGMQLSLLSRDVVAMSTAVALSHDVYDGVLCLGGCDKIAPGLMIGVLSFGHLPTLFVPAGPMESGSRNVEKAAVRERFATGEASREELLRLESEAYHSPGTCTFYGTANSNQVMMEMMGVHLPGAAFVGANTPLRDALTVAAARRVAEMTALGEEYTPLGRIVDERAIVNAIVGLMATGGSTNHAIHVIAMGRTAGIRVNWDDFDRISAAVPLLARIYPNGAADVNDFHAAGGMAFLIGELLNAGLLHADVLTSAGAGGLRAYRCRPVLGEEGLSWVDGPVERPDPRILRTAAAPFQPEGGLKLMKGNLGRAVLKTSSLAPENMVIEARARVFDCQEDLEVAFEHGNLEGDFVAVIRFQGPRANGMPELHKVTPLLGSMQKKGARVGLVTDGRMSGASGKIPAALHVTPESADGGPLARVCDGDMILIDAEQGLLEARVPESEWKQRDPATFDLNANQWGTGRELFQPLRAAVSSAEEGASVFTGWMRS
jgi:phosphogluconate dehydratase